MAGISWINIERMSRAMLQQHILISKERNLATHRSVNFPLALDAVKVTTIFFFGSVAPPYVFALRLFLDTRFDT